MFIKKFIHIFSGMGVIASALLADYIFGNPLSWGNLQLLLMGFGLIVIFLGFVPHSNFLAKISTNLSLSVLSLLVFTGLCEGFFRIIEYDFAREEEAWKEIPPYYRLPIVPMGEVFYRRPGPESWTGQVRNTRLMQLHIVPNPYADEPVVTLEYNKLGFRNPDTLLDWDIAVSGDSFTELGFLRYEELFTTMLGEILNAKILNLGVSYAGPLTQLSYLKNYGISEKTKHVIIIFFEGNDLDDLAREYNDLMRWEKTGQRNERKFKKQTSFLKALYSQYFRYRWQSNEPIDPVNAYFKSSKGEIPISLFYTPPGSSEISDEVFQALDYFFSKYAEFAAGQEVTPWVAYMPSKRRVLEGRVRFVDGESERIKHWQPTDLPKVISEFCIQSKIKFIDLTPPLVEYTREENQLVYSSLVDTHLSAIGSRIVARELAKNLAEATSRLSGKRLPPIR